MKKFIILFILSSFFAASCVGNGKSSTQIRIKKQEKHRKKHDCPQLDC